jgi:Flp pilus assembly protein TadG
MKRRPPIVASQPARGRCPRFLGDAGSVAVELGLLGGLFLVPLMLGIIQYGIYFNATQALAAATRTGAEYARNSATCKAGIQVLQSPPVSGACTTGIQNTITNSMNYPSGALTFPATFPLTCQCDDGTAITCGNNSCATAGRPAPNRVFITISASQTFTPFVTLWTVPSTINGVTDIRIQ